MTSPASDADPVAQFLDAMASAGVHIDSKSRGGPHPIADGRLHRADATGAKKKRGNQHVWYTLHLDEPASGSFGDFQLQIDETWTAGRKVEAMTAAERAVLRERMASTRREREAELAALNAAAATAADLIMKASQPADPAHPYLERKALAPLPGLRQLAKDVSYTIEPGERPRTARAGSLVVPLYRPDKTLASVQLITDDGTKRFLKGTAKAGNYHSIGRPSPTVVVGEGYATCARIHAATGHLVIVAFDAGNLKAVADAMRAKFPDAAIIIAADNDVQTAGNPGLTKAREAATSAGALLALPLFATTTDGATDFDDLARLEGLDAVREAIDAACAPNVVDFAAERAKRQGPPDDDLPPLEAYDDVFGGGNDEPDHGKNTPDEDPLDDFGAPHFRGLGVDKTTFFFQPRRVAELIEIPTSAMRAANFMRLAPLQWWQGEFPAKSGKEGGVDWHSAMNACIAACLTRGKFVSTEIVRGRGAWFEGDTPVFHAGDRLIIDGQETTIDKHRSRYVYDEGKRIDVDLKNPLGTTEAREFLDICKTLRWASPLSGYMLAGLCAIAPICGFLNWRPHTWVSGPSGAGKSTVIRDIILQSLGDMAVAVVGPTTEPGIRRELKADAIPVVFDEAEPKDMSSKERLRAILDFARVAASEGKGSILKGASVGGGAASFRARSMFVFASINMQIEGYADDSRITSLILTKPENQTPAEAEASQAAYETLKARISGLVTPRFSRRLLARVIQLLPQIRENVRTFTTAAALHLGDQRLGDQAGPLLAGAFALNSEKVIDVQAALAWIRTHDWGDHSAKNGAKDSERFRQTLTGYVVKGHTPEGGVWERTIGELMALATHDIMSPASDAKQIEGAVRALANLGIKINQDPNGWLAVIATHSTPMKNQVFRNTEWAGAKLGDILKSFDGASVFPKPLYFSTSVTSRAVEIPLNELFGGDGH